MDNDAYDALSHHILKQVRHVAPVTSSLFVLSFFADARRRVVYGEHPRRRLPSYPTRPVPRVSLREPLPGTLRGGCPRPKPPCRCQGTQRRCPRGAKNGVGSTMNCY
jgi:hypothetical protein